jgi:FKBP-type peptidyl-prolyl cis-trans isomerase FkpA
MSGATTAAIGRLRRPVMGVRRALSLVLLLGAAACGDNGLGPDPEDVEFAASLGINLATMTKLPSGVYVQTVTPGTGTATVAANSLITIAYKGWLADGTQFDESRPTLSGLRANEYVPGFTDGVMGMKVGEVRKIVIPSSLGYGDQGQGPIPGKAVLIFEVRLVSIP